MSLKTLPPVIRQRPSLPAVQPTVRLSDRGPWTSRALLFRVGIVILLIVSILVAWWSFARILTPRLKQARELNAKVTRLSAEVEEQERLWSEVQAGEVLQKYGQVDSVLFGSEAAIGDWLARLDEQARPLALEVRANFGRTSLPSTNEEKLAVIPTTIALDISPARTRERSEWPYQRLLRLVQNLAAVEKRTDLAELTVVGGTNSTSRATLVFELWAGEGITP